MRVRRINDVAEMMRCLRLRGLLQAFLDGQVDEGTAARIERHLAACRRCGLEAAVYVEIKRALARRGRGADDDAVRRLHAFAEHLPDADGRGE